MIIFCHCKYYRDASTSMSKQKARTLQAHLLKCLVQLEPITRANIMKSGSIISAATRQKVLMGNQQYRQNHYMRPHSHYYHPVKVYNSGGKSNVPPTFASLKKQVANQLRIIDSQDVQIYNRDEAINKLRRENAKVRSIRIDCQDH